MSLNRQTYKLPGSLSGPFAAARDDWKKNEKVRRLWQRDASLWTGTDENKWLDWLGITEEQLAHLSTFQEIAADVKKARFKHALLLGTISFDAVRHLLLCRIERRPPRLDMENYPHLPMAQVRTTQAADYMSLLVKVCA